MTWTLVAVLQEKDKSSRTALQQEIESWFDKEFVEKMHQRSDLAQKLLKVPRGQAANKNV